MEQNLVALKVSDNVTSFPIPWSQTDLEVYSKVVEVEPGEVYNFSVSEEKMRSLCRVKVIHCLTVGCCCF